MNTQNTTEQPERRESKTPAAGLSSDDSVYCHVTNYPDDPCREPVAVRVRDASQGYYCLQHAAMLMRLTGKRAEDFIKIETATCNTAIHDNNMRHPRINKPKPTN